MRKCTICGSPMLMNSFSLWRCTNTKCLGAKWAYKPDPEPQKTEPAKGL